MRLALSIALLCLVAASSGPRAAEAGCSPSYHLSDHTPVWSPAGDWIAFDHHAIGCGRPAFLTTVRPDGSERRQFRFNGRQRIEWTPDGSALAAGLTLVSPDGRIMEEIGNEVQAADPSFSPDGRQIAFSAGAGLPKHIRVLDLERWTSRALTQGDGEYMPIWSPRGDVIAFASSAGLEVVQSDGSDRRILWRGRLADADPAWSPDGDRIAFLWRADPGYTASALRIQSLNGSGRDVATGALQEEPPAWRPDGERVGFTRVVSSGTFPPRTEIATVASDGSSEVPVALGEGISWSPDGNRIAFASAGYCDPERLGIFVASADGSEPRRITNDCRIYGGPGNDVLRGTFDDDELAGFAGADRLLGDWGEDVLRGGAGNDFLNGGQHPDRLFGNEGADVIFGGGGRDVIVGGSGRDRIDAGIAKDTIDVRDGEPDRVVCGTEFDIVRADRVDSLSGDCERIIHSQSP